MREKRYFKIRDLCSGLDGLVVETEDTDAGEFGLYSVNRLINTNSMIGDRLVISHVAQEGMYISAALLEECENPTGRQFAHDNPFGRCISEEHHRNGDLMIDVAKFEHSILVTLRETPEGVHTKTLYTRHLDRSYDDRVSDIIKKFTSSTADANEDLVFVLEGLMTLKPEGKN